MLQGIQPLQTARGFGTKLSLGSIHKRGRYFSQIVICVRSRTFHSNLQRLHERVLLCAELQDVLNELVRSGRLLDRSGAIHIEAAGTVSSYARDRRSDQRRRLLGTSLCLSHDTHTELRVWSVAERIL